jgi:hypothetical protein
MNSRRPGQIQRPLKLAQRGVVDVPLRATKTSGEG